MQTLFALQQLRRSDQQIAWDHFRESAKEAQGDVPETAKLEKLFRNMLTRPGDQGDFPADLKELAEKSVSDYRLQVDHDLKYLRTQMLNEVEGINKLFHWVMGLFLALADFEDLVLSRKKPLSNGAQPALLKDMQSIELIRKSLNADEVPSWNQHQDRLSQWYKEIKSHRESLDQYQGGDQLERETGKLKHIFKSILWKSESFQNFFEEHDRGWIENKDIIKSLVNKTLKSISEEGVVLAPLSYQWEDDKQFFTDIFDATLENESRTEKLVAERAKNWEMDRIAQVDMVLLKMAVTEMINFPSIPVKVTINEYIELSKKYSTPKSKKFINGILDVLADHLTEDGTIRKSGRGLIDNK